MELQEQLSSNRDAIIAAGRKRGATRFRIFGSVARGTQDSESDVDFLVDLEPGRSLLDLGGLQMDLSELLQCRVDVITEAGLRPRIRERVLAEAKPL